MRGREVFDTDGEEGLGLILGAGGMSLGNETGADRWFGSGLEGRELDVRKVRMWGRGVVGMGEIFDHGGKWRWWEMSGGGYRVKQFGMEMRIGGPGLAGGLVGVWEMVFQICGVECGVEFLHGATRGARGAAMVGKNV